MRGGIRSISGQCKNLIRLLKCQTDTRSSEKKSTLVSKIEDLLFEGKVRVMDRKLNELLNKRFDGRGFVDANRNVLREGFLRTPRSIFAMRGVLGEMQASDRYAMMERTVRDEMDMEEDVRRL
ncbi:retrotransposon hot spot (RHS) protein [Trypanosoma cruzi]|nr:retrotransposon hot spot (RHS) protein [Trypanosoma cruzi]